MNYYLHNMNYSQKSHNLFLGITQIIPWNYINLSIFTCFVYLFFSSTVPTKFPDFLNNFNPQSWKQQQKSKVLYSACAYTYYTVVQ